MTAEQDLPCEQTNERFQCQQSTRLYSWTKSSSLGEHSENFTPEQRAHLKFPYEQSKLYPWTKSGFSIWTKQNFSLEQGTRLPCEQGRSFHLNKEHTFHVNKAHFPLEQKEQHLPREQSKAFPQTKSRSRSCLRTKRTFPLNKEQIIPVNKGQVWTWTKSKFPSEQSKTFPMNNIRARLFTWTFWLKFFMSGKEEQNFSCKLSIIQPFRTQNQNFPCEQSKSKLSMCKKRSECKHFDINRARGRLIRNKTKSEISTRGKLDQTSQTSKARCDWTCDKGDTKSLML